MDSFLAVLSGLISSISVQANGQLSNYYGNYRATVLIHLIGLVGIVGVLLCRRLPPLGGRRPALPLFLGGAIGVCTVACSNLSYAALGVSLTLSLSLLGQMIISLLIDTVGWFGIPRRPFHRGKLLGLALILSGTSVMFLL